MKRLNLFILLVMLACLLAPLAVHAQDAAQPLTPGLSSIPTTPSGVIAVITFFGGSIVVSGLVGLLKLIPGNEIDAGTLKEWVALAVAVVYLAFVFSGHEDLFGQAATYFDKALPFILGLVGVFKGSQVSHQLATALGVPLFGTKRTPQIE